MLLTALRTAIAEATYRTEFLEILRLAGRVLSTSHSLIIASANDYFGVLAMLCQMTDASADSTAIILQAFSKPFLLELDQESTQSLYEAVAFQFLAQGNLYLFENNVRLFSSHMKTESVASAILHGYGKLTHNISNDDLLWLLSHFICLGEVTEQLSRAGTYLEALYTQLLALSTEISLQLGNQVSPEGSADTGTLDQFIRLQLLSLVNPEAISKLLRDLSESIDSSTNRQFHETSLLAGYISTLLVCFPSQSDDIRMKLFLESITTSAGEITTVRFFWHTVRRSGLFQKLASESQSPEEVLRQYAQGSFNPSKSTPEEEQWRVVILFLELYTFVLRLSDDEDFFSGLEPRLITDSAANSRMQACSFSLEDLKLLTSFLKNTAFALHYKSLQISQPRSGVKTSSSTSRLDSATVGATSKALGNAPAVSSGAVSPLAGSAKLDIASLRDIITTAMKMLYERDSRKPFLPSGHWLMTDKLDREDFVSAVIAEDERQRQEDEEDDSDDDDDDAMSVSPGFRAAHHAGLERVRHHRIRLQREQRLAELGPKLEILKHMPFVVPFETRVKIFRQFIDLDRSNRDSNAPRSFHSMMDILSPISSRHHADIRRGQLFDDAYDNFFKLGEGLKDSISITFVDQFGAPEAGIDGGGVTKEFLTSVTTEAFSGAQKGLHMFTSSKTGLLFPNPHAADNVREGLRQAGVKEYDTQWRATMSDLQRRYEFLGRIIGKCLYEGILVDLAFAGFFLLQWPSAGSNEGNTYKGSVNDLRDMDEDLYKGMLRLKNYSGDVSELGIDFTITDQVSLPNEPVKTVTRNLIPKGDTVTVTNDNRLLYISYVARHRLVIQPALQTSAFLRGLRTIIRPKWLSMFNQTELQRLVGGDSSEIDIEDLRANTVYGGLYVIGDDQQEHPTVQLFWKVMESFNDSQRRDLLKYVSSTPRAPLLGFSQLRPRFSIRDGGTDEQRLPSTSTCVNLLKLPQYRTEATMREKLLYAITSGAGFDLS